MLSVGTGSPANKPILLLPEACLHLRVLFLLCHHQPSRQGSSQLMCLPKLPNSNPPPEQKQLLLHILGSPGCHIVGAPWLLVFCLLSAWHCLLPDTLSRSISCPGLWSSPSSWALSVSQGFILGSLLADLAHLCDSVIVLISVPLAQASLEIHLQIPSSLSLPGCVSLGLMVLTLKCSRHPRPHLLLICPALPLISHLHHCNSLYMVALTRPSPTLVHQPHSHNATFP